MDMKFFLFIVFSSATFLGFSQITIDMDDLPQPGQEYYRSTGTSQSLDPTMTGGNYTWDYSDLETNGRDTLIYNTISQTPIFYQFQFNNPLSPQYLATEARYTEDLDLGGFIQTTNNYLFSKTTSNSWNEVGIGTTVSGIPLPTKYSNIKTKLNLPITYGDMNTDNYAYLINIPAIGTIGQDGDLSYEVDGWGSLTTPGGTWNTLRVKTTTIKSDTIYINLLSFGIRIPSTEVTYEWYASNEGFPVLTVTEQLGVVSSINYLDDPVSGVTEYTSLKTRIYPNPVSETIYLQNVLPGSRVSICTITGMEVLNQSSGNLNTINVKSLKQGMYFMKIQKGNQVETHRFIKD
jgi:hypothetical protein